MVRPLLAVAWLIVAAGFVHLFANVTRHPNLDARGWIAIAGVVSLALGGLTIASRGRWIRLASNATALGQLAFASLLVAMRLAHETGIALVASCALILATGVLAAPTNRDDSGLSAGDQP